MGNIMDGVPMKRDHIEDLTKEILGELKDLVEIVDHSLAGLAKSADSMQTACEMLLCQHENSKQDSLNPDSEGGVKSDTHLAMYLLRTINESMYDHKFVTMGSFMKLLKFIKEKVNKHVNTTFGEELRLTVDKYNECKELPNTSKKNSISYCDIRIEELWKEIERLKKIIFSQKKQIQSLTTKEEELVDESGTLNKTITTLENQTRKLEEELYAMKKEKSEIVKENEDKEHKNWNLEKQIEMLNRCREKEKENEKICVEEKEKMIRQKENVIVELQCKIEEKENDITLLEKQCLKEQEISNGKIEQLVNDNKRLTEEKCVLDKELQDIKGKMLIQVQLKRILMYSSQYGDALIKVLRSKIELPDLKVEITEPLLASDTNPEKPFLLMCSSSTRQTTLTSKIEEATKPFEEKSKIAMIFIHTIASEDEVLSIEYSDVTYEENSRAWRSFGGIYNLAFKHRQGFIKCELNDKSIEGIVNFIQNEGVKVSQLKLFMDNISVEKA